jgi:hypothetical protein
MGTCKHIRAGLWILSGLSAALTAACGQDEVEEEGSTPKAAGEANVLDCTEVEGRTEEFPGDKELYYPDAIKEQLETYDFLRERFGADEVTDCEQARLFAAILLEENDRIVEQHLAENPEVIPDDAVDISEIDTSGELGPPDEGQGGAGPVDDMAGQAGAAAMLETAGAGSDIAKIHQGIRWQFEPVMRIHVIGAGYCSATALSPKWMITAAHCMPIGGFWEVRFYKQRPSGLQLQFGGKVWVDFKRKPFAGGKDAGNDVALGKLWGNVTFSTSSNVVEDRRSYARIWLGDNPAGYWQYSLGYGKTYTSDPADSFHYGFNTVTEKTYSNFYRTVPTNINKQDICSGDSGGPTGYWHDGLFAIHGINSVSYCGKVDILGTGFPLWGSWFHRVGYYYSWIHSTVGTCRYVNLSANQGTVLQCFP